MPGLLEIPSASLDDSMLEAQPQLPWRCRALVVNDDDGARAKLAALLTLNGYEVETANGAEEALRIQLAASCQIVLTDWRMPNLDGPALCLNLRNSETEGYVYILILSERSSKPDILVGLDAGADDYICKDAAPEELLARIEVGRRIMRLERSLRMSCQENRRLSVTDALTGTHNRRYLMTYLPFEIARSRRYCHPLAILCCDIDLFKRVNDSFGHDAGDDVLREFVSRSRSCLRDSIDWIARSGGEEFVIVMPETDLDGAVCVADKLRHAFSDAPIPTCAGRLNITVSVGATALETSAELERASMIEILRAADRCLYVSKRLGRDRVTALPSSYAASLNLDALGRERHEFN